MLPYKAQVIAETLFVYAILFFFSMIMIVWIFDESSVMLEERKRAEINRISYDVANIINTAVVEGNGFSINFLVPYDVIGTNYSLYIDDSMLVAEWENRTLITELLTSNISGTLKKGLNVVKNENNQIFIE
jgi:hypothetical protein